MSDRTSLILIDPDPIFRLGLSTALASFTDLQIVAQADNPKTALETLAELTAKNYSVDLVISELNFSKNQPTIGLECQQLKAQYPQLPILLISSLSRTDQLIAAKTAGIEGYCPKGTKIKVLVQAIRQLLAGEKYWHDLPTINYSTQDLGIANNLIDSTASGVGDRTVHPKTWHYQARRNGIQQINNSLAEVTSQLKNPNLSNLDWLFWSGRRRELLAARWLVNQLLPGDVVILQPVQNTELPLVDSQAADR
ncbi:MAG: response regulator transcription factor, partial [Crinalium sp.]